MADVWRHQDLSRIEVLVCPAADKVGPADSPLKPLLRITFLRKEQTHPSSVPIITGPQEDIKG